MGTPTPECLATLTLEAWRASGARTEGRRADLLRFYAESYFGPATHWGEGTRNVEYAALLLCRQRTRIDELTYEAGR